jgi:hypothetical protein
MNYAIAVSIRIRFICVSESSVLYLLTLCQIRKFLPSIFQYVNFYLVFSLPYLKAKFNVVICTSQGFAAYLWIFKTSSNGLWVWLLLLSAYNFQTYILTEYKSKFIMQRVTVALGRGKSERSFWSSRQNAERFVIKLFSSRPPRGPEVNCISPKAIHETIELTPSRLRS